MKLLAIVIFCASYCANCVTADSTINVVYEAVIEPILYTGETIGDFTPSEDVKFYLYTRQNEDVAQEIVLDSLASLLSTNFDSSRPTRFIIHGYIANSTSTSVTTIKNAYLDAADLNVIMVDWYGGARLIYPVARTYVVPVGEVVAEFVDFICNTGNQPISTVYLVGLSLGAHVAGNAGRRVTTGVIPVIFALDPAGPEFIAGLFDTIMSSDALYVETIRCNVGLLGIYGQIGHADFYANGGTFQPGCDLYDVSCHHQRTFYIFAESLISIGGFKAKKCTFSIPQMNSYCGLTSFTTYKVGGEPAQPIRYGVFQFNTTSQSPYAIS